MENSTSSPGDRASKGIPVRRVVLKDPSQMPSHYSETPGGTIFSTTPGGTRIIYERKFLMEMRHSPLSQTPTKLPVIPGVTLDCNGKLIEEDEEALEQPNGSVDKHKSIPPEEQNGKKEDTQFDMDI